MFVYCMRKRRSRQERGAKDVGETVRWPWLSTFPDIQVFEAEINVVGILAGVGVDCPGSFGASPKPRPLLCVLPIA